MATTKANTPAHRWQPASPASFPSLDAFREHVEQLGRHFDDAAERSGACCRADHLTPSQRLAAYNEMRACHRAYREGMQLYRRALRDARQGEV